MDYPFAPKTLAHAENRTNLLDAWIGLEVEEESGYLKVIGFDAPVYTRVSAGVYGSVFYSYAPFITVRDARPTSKPYGGVVVNILLV